MSEWKVITIGDLLTLQRGHDLVQTEFIDWNIRESARAKMMVIVKRTLTKYGYPPDKQAKAIDTVLKQAEFMADLLVK